MPRPLRVLLEASCLGDGRRDAGIGRYASQLIDALRSGAGTLRSRPRSQPSPAWSEARPARFLRAQPHVLAEAIAGHPHLVHGLGGEPVIGFPKSRQVVTLHDVEMWRRRRSLRAPPAGRAASMRRCSPRSLRSCAAIIAVSESTRAEAIAALGLDPARIHVVPHGVGPVFSARPKLRDARVAEALGLDEPFVLWVGSLRSRDPRKGLDTLLEAMERLPGGGPAAGPRRRAGPRGRPPRRRCLAAARAHRPLRAGRG